MKPILKWPGGKRHISSEMATKIRSVKYDCYYEPFVGGGSIFLELQPTKAVISDINEELILFYTTVRDKAKELIELVTSYEGNRETFIRLREMDRLPIWDTLTNVERSARFLYINKFCFNGIYRLNKSGKCNSTYNNDRVANFVPERIVEASRYFNDNDITFRCCTYEDILEEYIKKDTDDMLYMDPPYYYETRNLGANGYMRYDTDEFSGSEHIKIADYCMEIENKHKKFIMNNADSVYIESLFYKFNIGKVDFKTVIAAKHAGRQERKQLIISNF